ncbi:MAG: hydrogenase maturation nickel metallochaperone HypA [Syntrophaceae bacterium]|nr:hydrogenase maturation nickel metallochaperone HypA [Syntrophaceae bacterium]
MHEFSVSSEIVKNVLDATQKNKGGKVLSIQLEIGELTFLNVEQVTFWIIELFKGSVAEGAEVKIKTINARIHCKVCGYKGGIRSGQKNSLRHLALCSCPKCNSFQFKTERGQECVLRRIKAVK